MENLNQNVFTIKYYKNWDKQVSQEETFLDFNAAYLFYTSLKAYILFFYEKRSDGTIISYTTNRFSEFKGSVFCWPVDKNPDEIHLHQKP